MANADPFADPTDVEAGDPFSQPAGGGSYLKPAEIEGELILLVPIDCQTVPDKFNEGKMVDRFSADTVVLTGELAGTMTEGQYWSQAGIVGALKSAQRRGQKAILGRLVKSPNATAKKAGIDTQEKFDAAMAKFLADPRKNKEPGSFWNLAKFTDEDAAIARAYLAENPI